MEMAALSESPTEEEEDEWFCHVEAETASYLKTSVSHVRNKDDDDDDDDDWFVVDSKTLRLRVREGHNGPTTTLSQEWLTELADRCESAVFGDNNVDERRLPAVVPLLLAMTRPARTRVAAQVAVATLWALNLLESCLFRVTCGANHGHKAPLLKHMIDRLAATTTKARFLVPLLQTLLLPSGLNLRNLLWHGFVGCLPTRRWIALCIVVMVTLEEEEGKQAEEGTTERQCRHKDNKSTKHSPANHKDKDVPLPLLFDNHYQNHQPSLESLGQFCGRPELRSLVDWGSQIVQQATTGEWTTVGRCFSWNRVPVSHQPLLQLAVVHYIPRRMYVCAAAILSLLLEHVLRLDWARCNQRPDDAMARRGAYYVTLDGVGQRDFHDTLLHPQVRFTTRSSSSSFAAFPAKDDCQETCHNNNNNVVPPKPPTNQLLFAMGGSLTALLTDLFASSCGGPNIRAAISHGQWDSRWVHEMKLWNETTTPQEATTAALYNASCILVATLHLLCRQQEPQPQQPHKEKPACESEESAAAAAMTTTMAKFKEEDEEAPRAWNGAIFTYKPLYSYTATTKRFVQSALEAFESLGQLPEEAATLVACHTLSTTPQTTRSMQLISSLRVPHHVLQPMATSLGLLDASTRWTAQHVLEEHQVNLRLAPCGAARSLLQEAAMALQDYSTTVAHAVSSLRSSHQEDCAKNDRLRLRWMRQLALLDTVLDVGSFAVYVALLSIERHTAGGGRETNQHELVRTVERTRMCLSTFTTFLPGNLHRALKAVSEYATTKRVQALLKAVPPTNETAERCCD